MPRRKQKGPAQPKGPEEDLGSAAGSAVESAALESVALEPAAVELAALEPAAVELAALELPALELPALEPAAVELAALEPAPVEPAAVELAAVELAALESPALESPALEPAALELPPEPESVRTSAVPPTAAAYAAARAALAAQMVGPLYGKIVEPEPEVIVPASEASPPPPSLPVARATQLVPERPITKEPPRHHRALVVAIAALLVCMLGLATEAIPIVTKGQPTQQVAGGDPSLSPSPSDPLDSVLVTPTLSPTTTATATVKATPAPTKKPTPKPTRKPTPKPTRKPTPKPTPTPTPKIFATWNTNPPTAPGWVTRTLAGASCTLYHQRTDTTPPGTVRTTGPVPATSGIATFSWQVTGYPGRTYSVYATCTLNGNSAQTSTYVYHTT